MAYISHLLDIGIAALAGFVAGILLTAWLYDRRKDEEDESEVLKNKYRPPY